MRGNSRSAAMLALILLVQAQAAYAVTRVWPGAAPCNGTLQACIDASAAGDQVHIATAAVIDEHLQVNKSLTVRAAPGRIARFAPGRNVTSTVVSSPLTLRIEGLHLSNGAILVQHSAAASVDIRVARNRLQYNGSGSSRILVAKTNANGSAQIEVVENEVQTSFGGAADSGIRTSINATTTGRIAFNRVSTASYLPGPGIHIDLSPGDAHAVNVFANRVEGGFEAGAIRMTTGVAPNFGSAGNATSVLRAFSNAVVCRRSGPEFPVGIWFGAFASSNHELRMFNNTVVGCGDPMTVEYPVTGAGVAGSIVNNLFAFNGFSLIVSGNVLGDFVIDRNLSHGNTFNSMPAGSSNTLTGDPLLVSLRAPRLRQGSPAINAGSAVSAQILYAAAGAPHVDADGRRRYIGTGTLAVDIGAFEFGDSSSLARNAGGAGSTVPLGVVDDSVRVQASKSFNPLAGVQGVANSNPLGIFHSVQWLAYAISGQMPAEASLHVFAPGAQGSFGSNYRHDTTAGNVAFESTSLSNTHLNGKRMDQAVVLATPVWLGGAQNGGNIAVGYDCDPEVTGAGCWIVANQQLGANMPSGFGFHIYSQDPSPNAFVHRLAGSTQFSAMLDHPILGNDPLRCARPVATPKLGSLNNTTFEFEHRIIEGRPTWGIWGDLLMPAGAEFYVFVDAAAFEACADTELFKDGFESG